MYSPSRPPFILKDLFNIVERQHELPWEPFREGIEAYWLYQYEQEESAAALLRFQPGAKVACHKHIGSEFILVLSGSQEDENGRLDAGSLMIHEPGTRHSVASPEGCIVLAIYHKPVSFEAQG